MENEMNAYRAKKKPINPAILLRSADGYNRAGTILLEDTKDGIFFLKSSFSPCVVNFAFACELYLKYLLIIKNIYYGKSHGLNYLYELLDNDIKNKIKSEYQKYNSILNFETCINNHTKTFEEFRYMHEYTGIGVEPFSLRNLTKSLKTISHEFEKIVNN